jgi:hypothetical protein
MSVSSIENDDLDDLDALEEQLLALKREEIALEEQSSSVPQKVCKDDCIPSSSTLVKPSAFPKYDYSTVDPVRGDVRGYKRAVLIRRLGAVMALGLAVIATVTVTYTSEISYVDRGSELLQSAKTQQMYGAAEAIVPEALTNAGDNLTPGEKILFENQYQSLLASEHRHERWDEQRAKHLVHNIEDAVEDNAKVS